MNHPKLIGADFFKGEDVVSIARGLIGKFIITDFKNYPTGGIITETEAYAGAEDRASHAYGGRKTERNKILYCPAGTVYVYLCYGIHSLFNIVSNAEGVPHAILLRAIFPLIGTELIRERRKNKSISDSELCVGPGKLTQGLGISLNQNGISIGHPLIRIEDRKIILPKDFIRSGPRIGVDYAGHDAALPYRFYVNHKDLTNLNFMSG